MELFYALFFLGYFLHMGLQVDAAVRSNKNGATSRLAVIKANIFVLAGRWFIAFIMLILLREHPGWVAPMLAFAGITVSGISLATSSWAFSGLWGYGADSILAFIPVLKNYIPSMNDVTAKLSVSRVTQPGQETKTTTTLETTIPVPIDKSEKPQ